MQRSKFVKSDHTLSGIEKKWGEKWISSKIYSPDLTNSKKPFYSLMMFPYPSAEGLHVGNMYAFTGADVFGRFMRMQGFDVFEPIGLDGFGIHSENYAIKIGRHPKEHAKISEKNFYRQLSIIGNAYAWDSRLETYDPDYYKWTQWLFIQMYKKGLAYKSSAMVNWCPSCKTVLADEQVVSGKCERCGAEVQRKEMSSWYFKITKYADRLLFGLEKIRWPKKIKIAQRQWIGRSQGLEIEFKIHSEAGYSNSKLKISIWTKYWETVFGVTFLVLSPEYWLDNKFEAAGENAKKVDDYIKTSLNKSEQERKAQREKTGVATGLYAINPVNNTKIPVFVADYVLADVGTGAVMGVPAHDSRDFEFAKKYSLDIVQVVSYEDQKLNEKVKKEEISHEGEGVLVNSGEFDGLPAWGKGRREMAEWMIKRGFAKWETNYHLRDWLISRQRYWGPPIPMIYCEKCDWQSVPEEDLPVLLPDIKDYKPKGDGVSPLANAPETWKKVACPNCGKTAERELDVSDTFLDSSWYFLAYPNLKSKEWSSSKAPFNKEIIKKWLPVDAYIGGAEHAVLHLLYSRFVAMVLYDLGCLHFEEPFPFLFSHGLLIKDGAKMSKSRGNVVIPDVYIEKYGADTLRTYLMFLGPYDQGGDFRDTGIEGMRRFVGRLWKLFSEHKDIVIEDDKDAKEILVKMHQTIKKNTEDMQSFRYNTAIASIMEFVNLLYEKLAKSEERKVKSNIRCAEWGEALKNLCLLIAPFMPHLAEEIWQSIQPSAIRHQPSDISEPTAENRKPEATNWSVHFAPWPRYSEELVKEETRVVIVQVNGKLRAQLTVSAVASKSRNEIEETARKDKKVVKWLGNKKVKQVIFVPERLINFVID